MIVFCFRLPGPEALIKPGVRDAQILLIREHGKAVCYQWSEEFFNWVFIGDVTGSDGSNNATASQIPKLTYEGKVNTQKCIYIST